MIKKSIVTCMCNVVVDGNEYEALTEVDKMLKKEYTLSEKATLIIIDTVTTFAEGCGINANNNTTTQ